MTDIETLTHVVNSMAKGHAWDAAALVAKDAEIAKLTQSALAAAKDNAHLLEEVTHWREKFEARASNASARSAKPKGRRK